MVNFAAIIVQVVIKRVILWDSQKIDSSTLKE